jgi:hypothetical protein
MAYTKLTDEEKTRRKEERELTRKIAKEEKRIEEEKNQKTVKRMVITIEWKKSRTWGYCPRTTAKVEYHTGGYDTGEYYASGYGYCKESTVIANAFNEFLKYKLHKVSKAKQSKAPYGIRFWNNQYDFPSHYFEGGVGTSCYYNISEFIGGEFKHVSNTKTVDVYEYIDK